MSPGLFEENQVLHRDIICILSTGVGSSSSNASARPMLSLDNVAVVGAVLDSDFYYPVRRDDRVGSGLVGRPLLFSPHTNFLSSSRYVVA